MIKELVSLKVVCDGCGTCHRWDVSRKALENNTIEENFYELFHHRRAGGASVYGQWHSIDGLHFCSKKCEGKHSVRWDVDEKFLEGVVEEATKRLNSFKKKETTKNDQTKSTD